MSKRPTGKPRRGVAPTALQLPTQSWLRLPNESRQAFAAFTIYLALAKKRSLEKTAKASHKSTALMIGWSKKWRWVERVAQHDASIESKKVEISDNAALDAYNILVGAVRDAAETVVDVSSGSVSVLDGASVRLSAAEAILDRVGIIRRKELVIKGDVESPVRFVFEVPQKQLDAGAWSKSYVPGNGKKQALLARTVEAETTEDE